MRKNNNFFFQNSYEAEKWLAKCRGLVISEYGRGGIESFEKWKKDGLRFMQKSFIEDETFPLLNDGRPELAEWLRGTESTDCFLGHWGDNIRFYGAREFLESMESAFSERMRKLYPDQEKSNKVLTICLLPIRMALRGLYCDIDAQGWSGDGGDWDDQEEDSENQQM